MLEQSVALFPAGVDPPLWPSMAAVVLLTAALEVAHRFARRYTGG